jgi:integrase
VRGTIEERGPGAWRLRVVVGYRRDGQPRQASRTVHGTRRNAQSELAKFLAEAEKDEAPLVGNMSVGAYLDHWMEHVRAHRQPDTTRNYALRCKRFKQEFGSVRLDKLKSHHLDAAYRRWLLEGLSPATINSYHGVLSSALGQAVKWGLISRSVAPLATLPTVARRRMTVPDVETVRLLVTKAEDSDPVLSAAIMLAALTGCRRGELLGLRWSDVERDQMVLQVQRSIKREEFGRVLRAGPTKTHQERKVALDPVMLAVIDTHRHRAEGWAADAGVTIAADGYMLTEDPTGETPMAPDTLTHRFSRLAARTGVGSIRFHDIRHSVATTLLGAGYDLAVVAGRLGHRDPTVTLRVYAHALQQRDRQAAITLGALLAPPGSAE